MLNKVKFVEIFERMRETEDTIEMINKIIRNSKDVIVRDFTSGAGLMITHTDIIIDLLKDIFDDLDTIDWWIYELDYGRKYKDGCITDYKGNYIDLSTSEKLYDYLIEEMKK